MLAPCPRRRRGMTDAPDREAIIDAVAKARPWRTPSYLVLYFLRRWAVLLFTLSFMLATRQHWAIAAITIAGALWFDLRVTPKAVDLRLDDREFVRKIYDLEVFEADLTEKRKRTFRKINILLFTIFLLLIISQFIFDYSAIIVVDAPVSSIAWFIIFLLYIAFLSRMYPVHNIPHPSIYRNEKIELKEWRDHGYYTASAILHIPVVINLFIIFFVVLIGSTVSIAILSIKDRTINDYIMLAYANVSQAVGFAVPIIMHVHEKGRRIARYILKIW